jgi:CheY-like chemotaxis protein
LAEKITPPIATLSPSPAAHRETLELRILVVEDNDSAREMLKALLELEGHLVETAADGRAALEILDLQPPEVALVDIGLPEIDGFELARTIRANYHLDDMLLVALTGYGQAEDRRRALDAGFDSHMIKPLDFAKFSTLLSQHNRKLARRAKRVSHRAKAVG